MCVELQYNRALRNKFEALGGAYDYGNIYMNAGFDKRLRSPEHVRRSGDMKSFGPAAGPASCFGFTEQRASSAARAAT